MAEDKILGIPGGNRNSVKNIEGMYLRENMMMMMMMMIIIANIY